MMFWRKCHDVLWNTSRCPSYLSAKFFELDRGEGAFEAFPRVKTGEQGRDLFAAYPGGVFYTLCTEAQPEITEVTEFHDIALCQLIWNDGKEEFYSRDHVGCAQRGHIACPFGELADAHSACRLDGVIILLRRFAMARSASFDDIEFDGHGQLLSIRCLQESRSIPVQEEFYMQAADVQFSGLKGGCTVMKRDLTPTAIEDPPASPCCDFLKYPDIYLFC